MADNGFADFTSAYPSTGQAIGHTNDRETEKKKQSNFSDFHVSGNSVFEIPPLEFDDDDDDDQFKVPNTNPVVPINDSFVASFPNIGSLPLSEPLPPPSSLLTSELPPIDQFLIPNSFTNNSSVTTATFDADFTSFVSPPTLVSGQCRQCSIGITDNDISLSNYVKDDSFDDFATFTGPSGTTSNVKDDSFATFTGPSSSTVTDNEFGDFGSFTGPSSTDVKDDNFATFTGPNGTTNDVKDDSFEDFATFTGPSSSTAADEDFGDFGTFTGPSGTSDNVKKDDSFDNFATFTGPSGTTDNVKDDSFGNFATFTKPSGNDSAKDDNFTTFTGPSGDTTDKVKDGSFDNFATFTTPSSSTAADNDFGDFGTFTGPSTGPSSTDDDFGDFGTFNVAPPPPSSTVAPPTLTISTKKLKVLFTNKLIIISLCMYFRYHSILL